MEGEVEVLALYGFVGVMVDFPVEHAAGGHEH
jgi:hypothetical protein